MNNIDKGMLALLVVFLTTIFLSFSEVIRLKEIIQTKAVCERYGLDKKTHAFDEKSEIITIQCK